jgi:hypothetical protein
MCFIENLQNYNKNLNGFIPSLIHLEKKNVVSLPTDCQSLNLMKLHAENGCGS